MGNADSQLDKLVEPPLLDEVYKKAGKLRKKKFHNFINDPDKFYRLVLGQTLLLAPKDASMDIDWNKKDFRDARGKKKVLAAQVATVRQLLKYEVQASFEESSSSNQSQQAIKNMSEIN